MKKKIYSAAILLVALFGSGQLFAQETGMKTVNTSRSNIKNNKTVETNPVQCLVSLIPNETGCEIYFRNEVKSPRDAATGLATGKRTHKPICFTVNSTNNSVTEVLSPRDAASGQSSGKRSAGNPIKGISVKGGKNPGGGEFNNLMINNGQITLPPDCPDGDCDLILSWSWGASNPGSSKTYCQCHFILTMEAGACVAIKEKGNGASNK
jgi:hypothetical protein